MAADLSQRILVTCLVRGDTRRYRSLHLVEQLRLAGLDSEFIHLADPSIWERLQQPWSAVVFQRVDYNQHLVRILDLLQRQGTLILSDFDDLIFDPSAMQYIDSPDFADPVRRQLYRQNMHNIQAMLEHSEACLASTDFLAQRIRQAGKPVWIHRNAFSLEMLSCAQKSSRVKLKDHSGRIVVGYASGTPTHNTDFELVKPGLMKLMRQDPRVELHLIGPLDPGKGWGDLAGRIRRQALVPWRRLPELLANFDINLAPLVLDNPFSQSKSEIKYMEAAMLAVPTIASPTDAFQFAIRHGENGWLAGNPEAWYEGLCTLTSDEALRQRIGSQACLDVLRDYHPVKRAKEIVCTLDDISENLRGASFFKGNVPVDEEINLRAGLAEKKNAWLPANYMQEPSRIKLSLYTLRNRGLKTLILSAWILFRRLISPIIPFRKQRQ